MAVVVGLVRLWATRRVVLGLVVNAREPPSKMRIQIVRLL